MPRRPKDSYPGKRLLIVGMEATCNAPWFERVLREHHHELWIGDAAEIRAAMVRKQKTDSRDALHILDLLLANRFPRIWVPSLVERDLRQMLRYRHFNQIYGQYPERNTKSMGTPVWPKTSGRCLARRA